MMRKALEQAKAGRLHILGTASIEQCSFDERPVSCADYKLISVTWIEVIEFVHGLLRLQ